MEYSRIHSISNYLLGEDLLLEIELPELQTMIKKYCPDFPEDKLKAMDMNSAKLELVTMANIVRDLKTPGKAKLNNYSNAIPVLNSQLKIAPIPYPYPKDVAALNATPVKKDLTPDEQEVARLKKMITVEFCPKFPKEDLDKLTSSGALRNEIMKMAAAVHKSILDPEFPNAPARFGDAVTFLTKWVDANGPVPYPYPEKQDLRYNEFKEKELAKKGVHGPSDLIPFPDNNELLQKYYNHTVDLGWPGKKIELDGKKIKPQPNASDYIPFELYYRGRADKDGDVRPYRMDQLVKKARDLVGQVFDKKGVQAIKKLQNAVETIIEADKKYKMSHKVHFRDKFAKFVSGLARALGGNEADDRVINWLARRSETMTVFEFQKLILDEVFTKKTVTDETRLKMDNLTKLIRSKFDNKNFTVSTIKSSSWKPGEFWFVIENAKKVSPITVSHAASPMKFYLDQLNVNIKDPTFKREFTDLPTTEEINEQLKLLQDWIDKPTEADKKYEYGAEDNTLTCKNESDTETIEMRPVFNERAGVSVYVTLTTEE